MPAGIWGEFRSRLEEHYGGPQALATGWVSHTQFEPHVGAAIFAEMAAEAGPLDVWFNSTYDSIGKVDGRWKATVIRNGERVEVLADILIDGTDLGDVAAAAGVDYSLGMDARPETGESIATEEGNDIIQDLTYAAILKDYGEGKAPLLERPENYDSTLFLCSCRALCRDTTENPHPCETMLTYGKLPNDKYMINWPIHGNDYYANVVEMTEEERQAAYEEAKNKTLQFIYFIQHDLGFTKLGIADDEFPTEDKLPFFPYHREGRRIDGLARLGLQNIKTPYQAEKPLYRTGIAVGDYPIDHHHKERPDAPEIDFPPVPSFSIPAGSLIPEEVEGLLMADKAISVTNIANGSTRLQPVILQVGQAAGTLAALTVLSTAPDISPRDIPIRDWQDAVLDYGGYLLPYYDISPEHQHFKAAQRIGATGILKATGEPYKWANRTWFYPDTTISLGQLLRNMQDFEPGLKVETADTSSLVTLSNSLPLIRMLAEQLGKTSPTLESADAVALAVDGKLDTAGWPERPLTKVEIAVLLDELLDPFHARPVGFDGRFK